MAESVLCRGSMFTISYLGYGRKHLMRTLEGYKSEKLQRNEVFPYYCLYVCKFVCIYACLMFVVHGRWQEDGVRCQARYKADASADARVMKQSRARSKEYTQ